MRIYIPIAGFSFFLLIASALWYAISHQYIIVATSASSSFPAEAVKNKEIRISWYHDHELHTENRTILWPEQRAECIKNSINAWLAHMHEEQLMPASASVESVCLLPHETEALVNLSESFFAQCVSIFDKACLLEGLLMTLHHAEPSLAHVRFLVNNMPFCDEHVDMKISLPLTGFFAKKAVSGPTPALHTVVINPAGDSKHTGRIINKEFERTLTFDGATHLIQALKGSHTQLILTRSLGDTVDPLHIMHTVNQRPTDLFIDLRCYRTQQMVPEVYVYTYCASPETDFWHKKSSQLTLLPLSRTYTKHVVTSYMHAARVGQLLARELGQSVRVHPPLCLPLTPLVGLTQPSIIIECGITEKSDLLILCQQLAQALAFYPQ